MIDRADRICVPAVRTAARNFLERKLGSRRDHKVVILQTATILQFQRISCRINLFDPFGHKIDTLLFQVGANRKGDALTIAPPHCNPRVGGDELEIVQCVDNSYFVLIAELFAQLIGCGHSAGASAKYDDVGHIVSWWL